MADPVESEAAGEGARRTVALGECGLVACGMLLLSPQSSKAHFCLLLLPAVFVADATLRGRRDWVQWTLLGGAAALSLGTAKGRGIELSDLRTEEAPPPRAMSNGKELDRVLKALGKE